MDIKSAFANLEVVDYFRLIMSVLGGILIFWLIGMVIRRFMHKFSQIHARFLEKSLRAIIVVMCAIHILEVINPAFNIGDILLRGSALFVAVLGFAAQPVISDLICGYQISRHKPFEIGDRIIVDGMEPGIVEDITLRHTVLRIYDGFRIVVPNSQMNAKAVINTSYGPEERKVHLTYSVSYDTDVKRAMELIRDCVAASPYTMGMDQGGIHEDSGPVYFLKLGSSAFILETTIVVEPGASTYIATTDVNLRVVEKFREHHIEIPYDYINVVDRQDGGSAEQHDATPASTSKKAPVKRKRRTDNVRLTDSETSFAQAMREARAFGERQQMSGKQISQLELLSEECIGIVRGLLADSAAAFWIEGSGVVYRIHLKVRTKVEANVYKELLALSSSGKNEAAGSLADRVRDFWLGAVEQARNGQIKDFTWSLRDDETQERDIGQSIVTALADDIKVSVTKEWVEVVVYKNDAA